MRVLDVIGSLRCAGSGIRGLGLSQSKPAHKDSDMAKGQKKSNKEIRKPKVVKAKAVPEARSFLSPPTKGK